MKPVFLTLLFLLTFPFQSMATEPDPEYVSIVREEVAARIDTGEISYAEGEMILESVLTYKYNPPVIAEANRNASGVGAVAIVLGFMLNYTATKGMDAVWATAEKKYSEVMARRERERRERSRPPSIAPGNGPSCRMPGGRRPGMGRP
jgi:hypothetical protein